MSFFANSVPFFSHMSLVFLFASLHFRIHVPMKTSVCNAQYSDAHIPVHCTSTQSAGNTRWKWENFQRFIRIWGAAKQEWKKIDRSNRLPNNETRQKAISCCQWNELWIRNANSQAPLILCTIYAHEHISHMMRREKERENDFDYLTCFIRSSELTAYQKCVASI